MAVVDSADINNVIDEIGESVNLYTQTEVVSSDYGSLTTQTESAATAENVIVQIETDANIQKSDGRIRAGDLFAMFKSSSAITKDHYVQFNSKEYKVKNLVPIRVSGSIHHFECNLEFVRDV